MCMSNTAFHLLIWCRPGNCCSNFYLARCRLLFDQFVDILTVSFCPHNRAWTKLKFWLYQRKQSKYLVRGFLIKISQCLWYQQRNSWTKIFAVTVITVKKGFECEETRIFESTDTRWTLGLFEPPFPPDCHHLCLFLLLFPPDVFVFLVSHNTYLSWLEDIFWYFV